MSNALHILGLEVENFKRVKAVSITSDGENLIQITGANKAGKSSCVDAIWWALAGRDASNATPLPVRDGSDAARVRLDLGEYIVTRTTTKAGKTTLTVESDRGAKYSSPQDVLNGLLGKYAFDPLKFIGLTDSQQVATLLTILGDSLPFDPDSLEVERAAAFESRKEAKKDRDKLKVRLQATETPAVDTPDKPVVVVELFDELAALNAHNASIDEAEELLARLEGDEAAADLALTEAVDRAEAARLAVNAAEEARAQVQARRAAQSAHVASLEPKSTEDVLARIADVDRVNQAVEQAKRYDDLLEEYSAAVENVEQFENRLEVIATTKREGLAAANLPVSGLSFDEDGVTLDGIPLKQVSDSEKRIVSFAIAMAANPTLRVIRMDGGEALDKAGIAHIAQLAADNDYQVWMSRVEESGTVGITIVDGEVAA